MKYATTGFPRFCRRTIGGFSLLAAFLIFSLSCLDGCGKKADPLPPDVVLPKAVSQLSAHRAGEGISLVWAVPAEDAGVTGFRILRSELETGGADCPGCPREYVLLADLAPGTRELVKESGGKYRYNDFAVRQGRRYSYRVIACYGSGICSEARESSEIKYD